MSLVAGVVGVVMIDATPQIGEDDWCRRRDGIDQTETVSRVLNNGSIQMLSFGYCTAVPLLYSLALFSLPEEDLN